MMLISEHERYATLINNDQPVDHSTFSYLEQERTKNDFLKLAIAKVVSCGRKGSIVSEQE